MSRMEEQRSSDEQVIDEKLWQAFWLGVCVANDPFDVEPEKLGSDKVSSLRATAAAIRAKAQNLRRLDASLREIAEGKSLLGPNVTDGLDPKVKRRLDQQERERQKLAQRLVAFLDRKDEELNRYREQK